MERTDTGTSLFNKQNMKMERVSTGISVFDKITGGFPKGRTMLITGDAGSGKTIFGLQFAKNCCEQGLKTAYITTEEDANDLKMQGNSFNWDLDKYHENGLLSFIELAGVRAKATEAEINIDLDPIKGSFLKIFNYIPNVNVVVIDNIGTYTAKLDLYEFRNRFDHLVFQLKRRNITALIILDSPTSKEFNEIALFPVYGAIKLMKRENPYTGRRERIMDIVKMRNTKIPTQFMTYEINSEGLKIISWGKEDLSNP